MNKTYTSNQAMARLDLTSRSDFYHLKRKFPQAFVVVNPSTEKGNVTQYDKKAFDKFVQTLKTSK